MEPCPLSQNFKTKEGLRKILDECICISEFLSRFVVEDGDDAIVEGLQMSLQDIDDPNRLIHFVRFRCTKLDELSLHLEELKLGNPYTRKLVRDVSLFFYIFSHVFSDHN
jgi:hypothetical protein